MNKKMLVLPLVVLAFGCRDRYEGEAGATSSPSPGASPYAMESPYASPGTMGSGDIAVEVVSVDTAGRTINVRETGATGTAAAGQGQRLTVSSTAATMLTDIRPGDRITITCDSGTAGTGTTGTGTTGTTGTGTLTGCTVVTAIARSGGAAGQ